VVEGYPTREAAERCGGSREAIKKRLQRASARLRAGGAESRRDRGVPDPETPLPIPSMGMNDDGKAADGRTNERNGGARFPHRGGRRILVRGCGHGRRDDTAPAGAGSALMEATGEPALRVLVLSPGAVPGADPIAQLVSYCDV